MARPRRSPIVRLTRWETTRDLTPRMGAAKECRWRVYGVDVAGEERVYTEHRAERAHDAWCARDPLWREAKRAMLRRLFADPRLRDAVLRINIAAALDAGNLTTAAELLGLLSPEALASLDRHLADASAGAS